MPTWSACLASASAAGAAVQAGHRVEHDRPAALARQATRRASAPEAGEAAAGSSPGWSRSSPSAWARARSGRVLEARGGGRSDDGLGRRAGAVGEPDRRDDARHDRDDAARAAPARSSRPDTSPSLRRQAEPSTATTPEVRRQPLAALEAVLLSLAVRRAAARAAPFVLRSAPGLALPGIGAAIDRRVGDRLVDGLRSGTASELGVAVELGGPAAAARRSWRRPEEDARSRGRRSPARRRPGGRSWRRSASPRGRARRSRRSSARAVRSRRRRASSRARAGAARARRSRGTARPAARRGSSSGGTSPESGRRGGGCAPRGPSRSRAARGGERPARVPVAAAAGRLPARPRRTAAEPV